jgi:hypothetical protein
MFRRAEPRVGHAHSHPKLRRGDHGATGSASHREPACTPTGMARSTILANPGDG